MSATLLPLRVFLLDIDTPLSRSLQSSADILLLQHNQTDSTALSQIAAWAPDVVLMPITDEQQRIAFIQQIRAIMPHARVVVITSQVSLIMDALHAGAVGYSFPSPDTVTLYKVIQDAIRQRGVLTDFVARQILKKHGKQLTAWERRVLNYIAQGKPLEEIEQVLELPMVVLQRHIGNVFAKMAQPIALDASVEAHRLVNQAKSSPSLSPTIQASKELPSTGSHQEAMTKWECWRHTVKSNIQNVFALFWHHEIFSESFHVVSRFHPYYPGPHSTRGPTAHIHTAYSHEYNEIDQHYHHLVICPKEETRSLVPESQEIMSLIPLPEKGQTMPLVFPHVMHRS